MIDLNSNIVPAPDAYRKRLGEMLDLTYELEGLLHIGVSRSSVPPRLNQLIVNKLNAIVALADEPARPEELNVPPTNTEVTSEYFSEQPVEDETEELPAVEEEPSAVEEELPAVEEEPSAEDELMEASVQPEPEEERPVLEEHIVERPIERVVEDRKKAFAEEPAVNRQGRLFSVNDRFLYARELFGGNLHNFDEAINEVITLDSYDEAEEYFISEWNVDAESPTGMRFLATIMKMF